MTKGTYAISYGQDKKIPMFDLESVIMTLTLEPEPQHDMPAHQDFCQVI